MTKTHQYFEGSAASPQLSVCEAERDVSGSPRGLFQTVSGNARELPVAMWESDQGFLPKAHGHGACGVLEAVGARTVSTLACGPLTACLGPQASSLKLTSQRKRTGIRGAGGG